MKKLLFLISIIGVVFALSSCKNKVNKGNTTSQDSLSVVADTTDSLSDTVIFSGAEPLYKAQVVYVDLDTVIKAYTLAKELEQQLKAKENKSRTSLIRKQEALQKKAQDFQRDYESGKFLTQAALTAAQQELLKGEQELQILDQKLTNEMLEEQNRLNTRLKDSLNAVLKSYIDEGRYSVILANNALTSNVLIAKDGLNITKFVVEDMNARYNKVK